VLSYESWAANDARSFGVGPWHTRMFALFKKRQATPPAGEPHPQHRNFARMFIPDALTRHRSGFLAAMSDSRASQTLQTKRLTCGAAANCGEPRRPGGQA
jgi:hypothetical protein